MGKKIETIEHVVLVCMGSDCRKKGAKEVGRAVKECVRELGAKKSTHIVKTKCNGMCKQGPIVSHQPSNTWIREATAEKVCVLLKEGFTKGSSV